VVFLQQIAVVQRVEKRAVQGEVEVGLAFVEAVVEESLVVVQVVD